MRLLILMILASVTLGACTISISERDFLMTGETQFPPAASDSTFQRTLLSVRHADGHSSIGWRNASSRAKGTVLVFLGNGETADQSGAIRIWQLQRMGYSSIVFDRRGLGQTGGKASVALLRSDALEICDAVRKETQGKLAVHGFSLGSGIAAYIAKERKIDALIIEGGTTTVGDYVNVHLPWYARVFARVELSSELAESSIKEALAQYLGPVLVAVGENDQDTVPELSRALFASLSSNQKELAIIPKAGHHALTTAPGYTVYEAYLSRTMQ